MTNTSFIGEVNRFSNNDKITPFVSYKVVSMLAPDEHGDVKLYGPHHPKHRYGFSDAAVCKRNKPCTKFEKCSCGFYGYSDINDAITHWLIQCDGIDNSPAAIVQVAFSGQVVVCEKGYRASHQRIQKVLLSGCCLCSKKADMLAPHNNGDIVPLCNNCAANEPVQPAKRLFGKGKISNERPAIPAITFDDFVERQSPSGFSKMKIGSASYISEMEKVLSFFEIVPAFQFLPGDKSLIPGNFEEYLSKLNQKDMDKVLSMVSGEMARRMTNGSSDFQQ